MFVLREYQQEACDIALSELLSPSKKRGVIVAPTASGKSLYTAYIARQLLDVKPEAGILVLQPSKELLEQNFEKYQMYGGEASVFSASMNEKEIGHVTYATIGSIKELAHMFQHVRYVIIDECHLVPPSEKPTPKKPKPVQSMYVKFLRGLHPDTKVLGLTASPFRMKTYTNPQAGRKYYTVENGVKLVAEEPRNITKINLLPRERPLFFNHFIHVTQIADLYDLGYLAPLKYIAMRFDGRFLEFNSTGAEFSEASMIEAMKRNDIMGKLPKMLADAYRKDRKHCLVFMRTVEEAKLMAEKVPFSNWLSAETKPKDRERIINDFKTGNIKTLFNVAVLTTGFDFPALDTIILARPTASLALYMQMIGRGIRIHPDKEYCAVVDMCDNVKRFGKVEDIRIENDEKLGWCIHNGQGKLLSGVRLDELKYRPEDDDW